MPRKVIAPPSAHDQLISMAMTMPLNEISELLKTATQIVKVRAQQGVGNQRAAVAQTARPAKANVAAPQTAGAVKSNVQPMRLTDKPPAAPAVVQPGQRAAAGAPEALKPPKPPKAPGTRGPRKGAAPPPVSSAAPAAPAGTTTPAAPEGTDIPSELPAQDAAEE